MANFYTESSVMLKCSKEEADLLMKIIEIFELLAQKNDEEECEAPPENTPLVVAIQDLVKRYDAYSLGFDAKRESETEVWIHDDGEHINLDLCADLLQLWLSQDEVQAGSVFCLTWACTCDKPRTDSFSGGGIVVTKDGQYYMNGHSFTDMTLKGLAMPVPSEQFKSTDWNSDSQMAILDQLFDENPYMKTLLSNKIEAQTKLEADL